ncbi:hypothetical protein BDR06DRAFT_951221 [Suillus hirtellus]|nr:hypothetical protein BDR06DRAFT_951221 [Suillus hirtellus]
MSGKKHKDPGHKSKRSSSKRFSIVLAIQFERRSLSVLTVTVLSLPAQLHITVKAVCARKYATTGVVVCVCVYVRGPVSYRIVVVSGS